MQVRIQKIVSIRDPEGNLGKRIEFAQEYKIPRFPVRAATEEAGIIQGVTQEVVQVMSQNFPGVPRAGQFTFPRLILFLTEEQYEQLGVNFSVNELYEIELSNQSVKFKKVLK